MTSFMVLIVKDRFWCQEGEFLYHLKLLILYSFITVHSFGDE